MSITSASKSHHRRAFVLLPRSSVGIVFCAAYDLVLRPYRG